MSEMQKQSGRRDSHANTQLRTPLAIAIGALGIAQIISWGSLYYAISVLGDSILCDLGFSHSMLFVAFTFSLVLSGIAAPVAGYLVKHDEGGVVRAGRH